MAGNKKETQNTDLNKDQGRRDTGMDRDVDTTDKSGDVSSGGNVHNRDLERDQSSRSGNIGTDARDMNKQDIR